MTTHTKKVLGGIGLFGVALAAFGFLVSCGKGSQAATAPLPKDCILACETPAGHVELHYNHRDIYGLGIIGESVYQVTAPNGDILTIPKALCIVIQIKEQPPIDPAGN
jgi:hypothetical protein